MKFVVNGASIWGLQVPDTVFAQRKYSTMEVLCQFVNVHVSSETSVDPPGETSVVDIQGGT